MNDELDAEEVELCEAQAAAMAQQMKAALLLTLRRRRQTPFLQPQPA